jgi:S-adenosylmethionine decarboxylase
LLLVFFGMIEFFGIFLVGFFIKLADELTDKPVVFHRSFKYLFSISYGVIGGLLVSFSSELATFFVAIAVSVLLAAKIDDRAHQLAIALALITAFLSGVPAIILPYFIILAFFGLLDELANDFVDALNRKGKLDFLQRVLGWRLGLDFAGLAIGLYSGNFVFFFAAILFDTGYHLATQFSKLLKPELIFFGRQTIFNCVGCPKEKLEDKKFCKTILEEIPEKIGMTKISKPIVLKYDAPKKSESGVSGLIIIAESHIALHTYPWKNFILVDVVSCKDFDAEKLEAYLEEKLFPRGISVQEIPLGEERPLRIKNKK